MREVQFISSLHLHHFQYLVELSLDQLTKNVSKIRYGAKSQEAYVPIVCMRLYCRRKNNVVRAGISW